MKNLNQIINKVENEVIEDEVWDEFVKDIKKQKDSKIITDSKPVIIKEITPSINLFGVYQGNSLDNLTIGNTDNIDNNTAKKFKRGEFRIEASLDLHGYKETQAYDAVHEFVKSSYQSGLRCVLIVTGKGTRKYEDSDDIFANHGLLKEKVPQWLNGALRPLILSINHPSAKDGGDGALYILLRRQRDK